MLPIIPIYVGVTAAIGFVSAKLWNHSRYGEWIQVRPVLGAIAAPIIVPFATLNIATDMIARAIVSKKGSRRQIDATQFNWEVTLLPN